MLTARPKLVVVTGRPGSGKSTLTPLLARALRCPALARDDIKEGLGLTMSASVANSDVACHANAAFFDAIRLLLDRGVSLIAEAAFQRRLWEPGLEPLRELADIRLIVCMVDAALAQERHARRAVLDSQRGDFHDVGPLDPTYEPPQLGLPSLEVDTSDGYRPLPTALRSDRRLRPVLIGRSCRKPSWI